MAKTYSNESFEELKKNFPDAFEYEEGYEYISIPELKLSETINVSALLCPQPREGYNSRLFFSKKFPLTEEKPWTEFYINDKLWYAYSWKTPTGLSLIQMIGNHIKARKK
jgi:hypothetical protein